MNDVGLVFSHPFSDRILWPNENLCDAPMNKAGKGGSSGSHVICTGLDTALGRQWGQPSVTGHCHFPFKLGTWICRKQNPGNLLENSSDSGA